MLPYVSKQKLALAFGLSILLLASTAVFFYQIQNNQQLPGGGIALVKLFWLASVLFCWFIVPALLLLDQQLQAVHFGLQLFLMNMLMRAVIELYMMYVSLNWHPYYGIAHDLFSIVLSAYLALVIKNNRLIRPYFIIMAVLFIIETGFAWYMLHYVHHGHDPVYYVPDNADHSAILKMTGVVVASLFVYLLFFMRQWWYARSS